MCKETRVLQEKASGTKFKALATQGVYQHTISYNYVKLFLSVFAFFVYVMQWSHMRPESQETSARVYHDLLSSKA